MIKKTNWNGFDHSRIIQKFEGDLTYINEFDINGTTISIYKAANPNREKGHKDFMGLLKKYNLIDNKPQSTAFVTGFSKEDMEKYRYASGVLCLDCKTTLYSCHNHDYVTCDCANQAMIDGGGGLYGRCGALKLSRIQSVKIDLFTDEVTTPTPIRKRGRPKKQ